MTNPALTPIDELDGPELDERLARAMGWVQKTRLWVDANGEWTNSAYPRLPAYHASIDALLRDVWPMCKEWGWHWRLSDVDYWGKGPGGMENPPPFAEIWKGDVILEFFAPTPQLALARAMLAVLEAGE